jgi:HSP20 family protein
MATSRLLPSLFADFDRLTGEMDRWLDNLSVPAPAVNVWETADAFHVELEVPGFVQDNLQVQVSQKTHLTIQGERPAQEAEGGRWHRRERMSGRFSRVLELPAPVDADKVEAKLENGVLHLSLPKAEEAKPRRIVVKSNVIQQ